jgi:hypothetical protein
VQQDCGAEAEQDWGDVLAGGGGQGGDGEGLDWRAGYEQALQAEEQEWRGQG